MTGRKSNQLLNMKQLHEAIISDFHEAEWSRAEQSTTCSVAYHIKQELGSRLCSLTKIWKNKALDDAFEEDSIHPKNQASS